MNIAIIGFAFGVWWCQQLPDLWIWAALAPLIASTCGLAWHVRKRRFAVFALLTACFAVGLGYATVRADMRLAERLSEALEGEDLTISGVVADLPQAGEQGQRFLFDIDAPADGVPRRISLSWYPYGKTAEPPPVVRAGERWQLTVRLRQPHGNMNPHGFDYEAWLFERGIGGIGYVRGGPQNLRLEARAAGIMPLVSAMRESIRDRFVRALPDSELRGVLVALVVGDQASITRDQWTLFARTGVVHLMSISGLHVTLTGAIFGFCVAALWRRSQWLMLRVPVRKAALLAGMVAAGLYVLLAGGGVPAQRTFYMLAVAAFALWAGRTGESLRTLLIALLAVLLIDPWAILAAGFWLSFCAVGALLLMTAAIGGGKEHWLKAWIRTQWSVTILTLPILLVLFQQFSLVSPVANAVAIPVISAIVTPLALIFALLPLGLLAELANWLLGVLVHFLMWLAAFPFANWQQAAPPVWIAFFAVLVAAWSFMPRGVPARWIGSLCFVPLVAWSPVRPSVGDMRVNVLDVGQGLSVHVQTAGHDLLYDAGPQYSPESDSGDRLIVPYLRAEGVKRLDRIVISHDDSDHNGGADSIAVAVPVADWLLGQPFGVNSPLHEIPYTACAYGQTWAWDSVAFEVLYPSLESSMHSDNDHSCVLRITSGGKSVLLPGDIEKSAESQLLETLGPSVHADILVAPHHGSKTSSQEDFVQAVSASSVIFANGYRNRFHHPTAVVVDRYLASGATPYRSDADGAVSFDIHAGEISVSTSRAQDRRYWHDRSY